MNSSRLTRLAGQMFTGMRSVTGANTRQHGSALSATNRPFRRRARYAEVQGLQNQVRGLVDRIVVAVTERTPRGASTGQKRMKSMMVGVTAFVSDPVVAAI